MSTTASPLAPRADFPALADHNYLNSASISIMAKPVREAMERLTRRILHAGTVSLDEEAEVQALEIAREGAAKLLGAHPDAVAITSSATEGLGSVGLGDKAQGEHREHRHRVPERGLSLAAGLQGDGGRGPAGAPQGGP